MHPTLSPSAACESGYWGQLCRNSCDCKNSANSCDAVTGICICDVGYIGNRCEQSKPVIMSLSEAGVFLELRSRKFVFSHSIHLEKDPAGIFVSTFWESSDFRNTRMSVLFSVLFSDLD